MYKNMLERVDLFRIRDYRYFALSGILFTIANGLIYIALSWYAYQQNSHVSTLAILISCMWLPGIIAGPFFGVLADRYSRKNIMIFANGCRGAAVTLYGCLFLAGINPNIYALASLYGFLGASYNSAAMPFVKQIIPATKLLLANATIDMFYEFGFIVGMGISGWLLLLINVDGVLLLAGMMCLLSTWFIYILSYIGVSQKLKFNFGILVNDYWLVFTYLKHHRELIPIYLLQALLLVLMMTVPVLLLPFVHLKLNGAAKVFAFLELCISIGMIVGGVISPQLVDKVGYKKTLLIFLLTMLVAVFLFSFNRDIWIAYLIYPFVGIGLASWAVVLTYAQHLTIDQHQGKLQGIFYSLAGILIVGIYVIQELLSNFIDIQGMYWLEGALIFFSLMVGLIWIKEHIIK